MRATIGLFSALAAAATLLSAGCGGAPDPCSSQSGACLSLEALGSVQPLDQIHFDLTGAVNHSFTASMPAGVSKLPVAIAILLPDVTGTIAVRAVGLSGGSPVGVGSGSVDTMPGGRVRIAVTLTAITGPGCSDQVVDGDETDVDCGGSCPTKCGAMLHCSKGGDCDSGVCLMGRCTAARCDDVLQNGSESDVDCGGSCPACIDGASCLKGSDCRSLSCANNKCAVATCIDTVKNGFETDLDCGGSCTTKCADGKACLVGGDCNSGVCMGLLCQPPRCDDLIRDGNETDVDCGGACPTCVDGLGCAVGSDCQSGVCNTMKKCAVPTCTDGAKNGNETDADCGGPTCVKRCGDFLKCAMGSDCLHKICTAGQCALATCSDTQKNGNESDVDCGGSCTAKCADGLTCAVAADCVSKVCTTLRCQAPSCTDMVKNGMESDLDCGAACPTRCADGQACVAASDCNSNVCVMGKCLAVTCGNALKDGTETDIDCGGTLCARCGVTKACLVAADCLSAVCDATSKLCNAPTCTDGALNGLETDVDCGGMCTNKCALAKGCVVNGDCQSSICTNGKCNGPLQLNTLTPTIGPASGNILLTLNGAGFVSGGSLAVSVGGKPSMTVNLVSPYQITAQLPPSTVLGKVPVQVTNGNGQTVSRGDLFAYVYGTVSFSPAVQAPAMVPFAVVAGDLNADGKPDLIVANNNGNNIQVQLNNSSSAFLPAVRYTTPGPAFHVAIGDWSGDGNVDLVAGDTNGVVTLLRGIGDGTFVMMGTVPMVGGSFVSLSDLNKDGKLDLLGVGQQGTTVGVALNTGGAFGAVMSFPSNMGPRSMVVADYTGDGNLDVVVANFNGPSISSFLVGNGLGGFAPPVALPTGGNIQQPRWVGGGDFDGDGKLDLAVANANSGNVSIYLCDGAGKFTLNGVFPATGQANGLAVGDFNGDGAPDVAVATGARLMLLPNIGQGKLGTGQILLMGQDISSVVTADFNGDGIPDMVASDRGSGAVTVLINTSK